MDNVQQTKEEASGIHQKMKTAKGRRRGRVPSVVNHIPQVTITHISDEFCTLLSTVPPTHTLMLLLLLYVTTHYILLTPEDPHGSAVSAKHSGPH